jgi:hypothetical protein
LYQKISSFLIVITVLRKIIFKFYSITFLILFQHTSTCDEIQSNFASTNFNNRFNKFNNMNAKYLFTLSDKHFLFLHNRGLSQSQLDKYEK